MNIFVFNIKDKHKEYLNQNQETERLIFDLCRLWRFFVDLLFRRLENVQQIRNYKRNGWLSDVLYFNIFIVWLMMNTFLTRILSGPISHL